MKHALFSFLLLTMLPIPALWAKNYAYVYIEGDKQTPFYVKVEGQMMPRLGKNYAILPNLDAGIMNVEILFQQNKYPNQKFVLKIPEGGNRGFVLQKVNDRQFALYDLLQGFYIVSGNKPDDDRIDKMATFEPATVSNAVPVTNVEDVAVPAFVPGEKKTQKQDKKKKTGQPLSSPEEQQAPGRFIEGMELNKGGSAVAADERRMSSSVVNNNADCTTPLSSNEFEDFALKILDKSDDDARIKVLMKNKGQKCFTTEQVRIIANSLVTQSGRYDVVKLLYPQTSDKENYSRLEHLFKTNFLKNKFREIIGQ